MDEFVRSNRRGEITDCNRYTLITEIELPLGRKSTRLCIKMQTKNLQYIEYTERLKIMFLRGSKDRREHLRNRIVHELWLKSELSPKLDILNEAFLARLDAMNPCPIHVK